ncbi:MAG: carboxylating nicotinate-nucleotide diphosphorylase [Candidatus Kapabacteria bacterium]|nr:carboxylating nicotinate-nucleotide diphosphorylase [Ignavibacteriota bacterium]MCW5884281.1 carboxylating nicotinate-nucleotide diphosphorylase [Candidatus Kapabacteria bacterium]
MIEYPRFTKLPEKYIKSKIEDFLIEDSPSGDFTSLGTIPKDARCKAYIESQAEICFAGEQIVPAFFGDNSLVSMKICDGAKLHKGSIIAEIEGNASEILTKERIILNLIQRLSAIATLTNEYVQIAKPYNVKILDTRKTTPGLRLFEKYAVAVGGGYNHRLDLSSGILIKDNHIAASGSISNALNNIKKLNKGLPIELEVEDFMQIEEALLIGVDGFLLDNMSPETTFEAVKLIRNSQNGINIFIESSGGINLNTLPEYVKTGINAVSIGALTHGVKSADIHIEIE